MWTCGEVFLDRSLGFGQYEFTVATAPSDIHPNLVASPFLYACQDNEFDVEYARRFTNSRNISFMEWELFPCIKPSFESYYPLYSDGFEAIFNVESGECDRPEQAPHRECNFSEAVLGVRTANAAKICNKVAEYKKSAKVARIAPRDPERFGISLPMHDDEDGNATFSVSSSAVDDTMATDMDASSDVADGSNSTQLSFMSSNLLFSIMEPVMHAMSEMGSSTGPAVSGRKLLQNPQIGGFFIINNPNLNRPSTGALSIHAVLVPRTDNILMWTRQQGPGIAYDPGMEVTPGQGEVSSLFNYVTGTYQVAPMRYAPFCSGQSFLSDGTILVAGGDTPFQWLMDGLRSIRLWREGTNQWETLPQTLQDPHWYPTQVQLPDDRTLIIGGFATGSGPPVPSLEVFDYRNGAITSFNPHPWLQEIYPNLLYPGGWLLPYVRADNPANYLFFSFACTKGAVLSVAPAPANTVTKILNSPAWTFGTACAQYSATGSALMLPLRPGQGYAAELVMFGGIEQFIDSGGGCFCDSPGSNKAYRLRLDQGTVFGNAGNWAWQEEWMPDRRNLVDSVLLPNGKVFITNGQRFGIAAGGEGGGGQSRGSVMEAWLYDPNAPVGQRFTVLAATTVQRHYHSVAFLLPDGDIFVAGSEQTDCTSGCINQAPPIVQRTPERYRMPYAFSPLLEQRPNIVAISADAVAMDGQLSVNYQGAVTAAVLMAPAAITHQTNMNQRMVELQIIQNANGQIVLRMPPAGGLIAPPGEYMLFLMNNELPCRKASWVKLLMAGDNGGPRAGNILQETFEGANTIFTPQVIGPAAANINLASGASPAAGTKSAAVTVNNPTPADPWRIQMYSNYVTLAAGQMYTVTADMRATCGAATVGFAWNSGPPGFANLPGSQVQVRVGANYATLTLAQVTPATGGQYRVQIDFAAVPAGCTVYVDNLVAAAGAGTPPGAGNAAGFAAASSTFEAGSNQPYTGQVLAPAGGNVNLQSNTAPYAGASSAAITVTNPTPAEPWRIQMMSALVPLTAGTPVTVTAYMRATAACTVNFAWNSGAPGYTNLAGSARQLQLGVNYALMTVGPVTPAATGNYRVQFDFAGCPAGTVVYIDNIVASGPGQIAAASSTFEPNSNQPFNPQVLGPAVATINLASQAAPFAGVASAAITITTRTPNEPWRVQLQSGFVDMVAGKTYTVTAQMRATAANTPVQLSWGSGAPNYAVMAGSAQQVLIGVNYAQYTFTVNAGAAGRNRIELNFGAAAAGTTVYLDNLVAMEV
eukprot:gene10774-10930_t